MNSVKGKIGKYGEVIDSIIIDNKFSITSLMLRPYQKINRRNSTCNKCWEY